MTKEDEQARSYEEQEARSLQALDAASIATLDQMKAEAAARADTEPPVASVADGQLTVAQLVAILVTLPQDLPVEITAEALASKRSTTARTGQNDLTCLLLAETEH
jgi:hypothetical protein